MNPKDIEEACAVYEYQFNEVDYTTAAKAQYENDLDYGKLQSIIEALKNQQAQREEMSLKLHIKLIKDEYRSNKIARGQAALKLNAVGIPELEICTLLEKWDNGNR